MAETSTVSSPAPRRRHGVLRVIAWIVGILIVLIVVAYFVGTSSAFFKSVILPKAGAALNAHITVSDASISPFHQVVLRDLKVQTTGTEPLVTAPEVRLRYSLMDIIRGNILVEEVALTSPTIVLLENPDGSSNLDPITKKMAEQPSKPAQPAKPSKPAKIDIRKVSLSNGTVRQVKLYADNHSDTTEISGINVSLENIKNGQAGKLALAANIAMKNNPPAPAQPGSLQATVNGSFNLTLSADLKPESIQGNTRLTVTHADGALAQADALGVTLDCDVSPTNIKQVALRFAKASTQLAELVVSGPFDMAKNEGKLDIRLQHVDKNLLNLAGASSGLDFGPTTIDSTNQVQLANAGKSITAVGQFNLNQLQVTRTNQTTPALDLHAAYDVTVDSAASNAVLRALTVTGTQKDNQIIRGELANPMTISWGNNAAPVGDSTLNFAVTHLDLANWKAFLADVAPAGDVNLKAQLVSRQAGKQLRFDVSSELDNFTAGSGSNQLSQLTIKASLNGQSENLKTFNVPTYKLDVARQNQQLVTMSGSAIYDQTFTNADVQLDAQLMLAQLLQALPRSDMHVTSGSVQLKAHVTQTNQNQSVIGTFTLADLTGKMGSNTFQNFGATGNLDLGMTSEQVLIRKLDGKVTQAQKDGGAFSVNGTYGLSNQLAQITAKLSDFNQNGLRPFIEPMLTGKQLTSIDINADASLNYDPKAASSVKASLQLTNLVVHDPKGQFPSSPLALGAQLDTSLNKQVADIRQCQLSLTPTARATNQVNLTGHVDMSQTNGTQGNLKLAADSLDLTTYYDLFGGQQQPTAAKPAAPEGQSAPGPGTRPASAPSSSEQEPPAQTLPFSNFTVDATIGRLYLHEVEITNFVMSTKLDRAHVTVDPFKLALNGAPVNAAINCDLSVPGYKYDVNFGAQQVPLAPLVDSFQPDRKGQLGGTFTAQAKVAGTGTTGPNLKKYLNGQFDLGSTNLNLSVVNIRSPILKVLVNVVGLIPELTRNPEGALTGLVGSLVPGNASAKTGSLSSELEKSPINSVVAKGNIGDGKVELQNAVVQSPAFAASATGTVMLADILTNSAINIPVTVSLSHSLAERMNLVPVNAPTNQAYVPLPNFLTMKGTVGEPKSDINKMALAGTVFRGISGIIPGASAGTNQSNLIQGILGGASGGAAGTNQTRNAIGGLIQGLGGALGGSQKPGTTTNAPPATNQNPVNNLLKGFFK